MDTYRMTIDEMDLKTKIPSGYVPEEITMEMGKANIISIFIFIPIVFIFGILYFLVWGDYFSPDSLRSILNQYQANIFMNFLTLFIILIIGIIIHELIHGITWSIYAKSGFKSVSFGFAWKSLTPYCHCKEPLQIKHYILGTILPGILLGIIPAIIAIITGKLWLLIFGIFFSAAAGGDFIIIYMLRKEKNKDLALDHPKEMGCFVFRKTPINPH